MTSAPAGDEPLFHLALEREWRDAVGAGGPYERSTIGRSLAEEGFIHCSTRAQLPATAERFYGGRDDVVVLTIDRRRVPSEIRVEDLGGSGEAFPHVYGPIPLDAVVAVEPWRS